AAGDDVGTALLAAHDAEIVVVKRGCEGARVFRVGGMPADIPAYRSERVFKIGSGDVFSAAFAHHWGERGLDAVDAADLASRSVAHFVDYHALPLPPAAELASQSALPAGRRPGLIYLAGPFFDLAQRWLVEEALERLQALGAPVFSPLHEVGTGRPAQETAAADLEGLDRCAALLALLDGADPGTLFEVGYARARGKPVVVLAERLDDPNLTMLVGTGCRVARDLTSALYQAAWAAME
ncbi:nucleoside 2-deoxyribosyltransferase, partial [Methylorubrum zatmanii]